MYLGRQVHENEPKLGISTIIGTWYNRPNRLTSKFHANIDMPAVNGVSYHHNVRAEHVRGLREVRRSERGAKRSKRRTRGISSRWTMDDGREPSIYLPGESLLIRGSL